MLRLLVRTWRVLRRSWQPLSAVSANSFVAPRLPKSSPYHALALLMLASSIVDKPSEWDPTFTLDQEKEENKGSVSNFQKMKILQKVKDLVDAGKFDEAQEILENAVETAKRSHNMEWTNVLLLILAKMAYNNKHYKKAEKYYIELNNNFNMPQERNETIRKLKVYTAFDLAKIYEVTDDYEMAEKLYKHCLSQIQVMNVGSEDYPWATNVLEKVLDSYSLFLADRQRLKEALHYRNMVYSLVKVFHGAESERACYCLNELGRLSALAGEDDRAMDYLAQALRIGKKIPIEKAGLCAIYVNNGLLLIKKRMFAKAKEFCGEAMRLARINKDTHGHNQAEVCLELIDKEQNVT